MFSLLTNLLLLLLLFFSFLERKCVLGCFIKGTGLGFAFGNVVDGTDCEKTSPDKCIEGQCTVSQFIFHIHIATL